MICKQCGEAILLQFPDGTGNCCHVESTPIKRKYLPKEEKSSFSIDVKNQRRLARIRKARQNSVIFKRKCAFCGAAFRTENKRKVYCDLTCKGRASDARLSDRRRNAMEAS